MIKAMTCGMLSTLFQLKFRQLLWCNSDFLKISDWLYFIGFFIWTIGISVKSHINVPLEPIWLNFDLLTSETATI